MHRAGKGALLKLPDALGRNPPNRDDLILARTGEWTQLRSVIRGVGAAIERGEFDDDEPEPYVLPANSVAFDAAKEAERQREDGKTGGAAGRPGIAPPLPPAPVAPERKSGIHRRRRVASGFALDGTRLDVPIARSSCS